MNILFLVNAFNTGGFEQLTLETVRRLSGDRFRFRFCCLKEEGSLAGELKALDVPVDTGFLHHKHDLLAVPRLVRVLKGESYDILFMEPGRNALLLGAVLPRFVSIGRKISAIHATRRWGREKMFRPSQIRMLKRLDGVVTCAAIQRDYLVREESLYPENLSVIFNGVDHQKFRPGDDREGGSKSAPLPGDPAPDERAIAVVASLTPEKGHDTFVDAAALTAAKVPDARFLIIGDGPERERIQDRIGAKGLGGVVRLLGIRRDLPRLLPRLEILALSSHPFRETLPISVMEGMACGLPTVTTDVGSMRDLVVDGETGLIVPPGDAEAMSTAFVRLLGDRERARAMGAAGRRRVEERFTLDRMVDDYGRYFERIAGSEER